jgi:hypothetical protein
MQESAPCPFGPIGLTSAGLDPAPDPARNEKVTQWLRLLPAQAELG